MQRKPMPRRRPPGFTLIELLCALFITAILFAMGYGAINQAVNHHAELEEQQARLLEVQTALRVIAQDLGQLTPRPVREPIGTNWLPCFSSRTAASAATAAATEGAALLSYTRGGWANPAGIPRPGLQRVSWYFEKDTLRREHLPVLDATLSNVPVRRELLHHVHAVTFRYMNGTRQWIDHWPEIPIKPDDPGSGQRTRPLAVEVTLELTDWGRIVRLFEIPQ